MMSSPISGSRQVASCASICCRNSPDAGAWVVSMVSAISLSLSPNFDIDVAVLDRHRIGLRRDHRRQAGDLAGSDVKARAVAGALDRHLPDLAFAERVFLVGAGVPDGVKLVVLGVNETDRLAVDLDAHHGLEGQDGDPGKPPAGEG